MNVIPMTKSLSNIKNYKNNGKYANPNPDSNSKPIPIPNPDPDPNPKSHLPELNFSE